MIILHSIRHKEKPQKTDIGIYVNAFKKTRITKTEYTAQEIGTAVENGHPILCNDMQTDENCYILGKANKYFKQTNWMGYDIDEGMTIKEVRERLKTLGIQASVIYPSFSCTVEHNKFRVLFKLVQTITNTDVYLYVWEQLGKIIFDGKQDKATKDTSRHFWGTKYKCIEINDNAVLNLANIIDGVTEFTWLEDNEIDHYVKDGAWAYRCRIQAKKREKAIRNTVEQIKEFKSLIGINKGYKKTDIMHSFENGSWDSIGGHDTVWKLMLLYVSIGAEKDFLHVIDTYHGAHSEEWTNQVDYAIQKGYLPSGVILEDFKKINTTEKINYTNYTATETHTVDKYIGKKPQGYINAVQSATKGNKGLLVAPTGSGKTHSVIEYCKEKKIKAVFIVPNSMTVEQIKAKYSIGGACENDSVVDALQWTSIIVCTWDKVKHLEQQDMDDYIYILDEVHQCYTDMYREKAISNMFRVLKGFKGGFDITATPKRIPMDAYSTIIEYKQAIQTKYNVKLYNKTNDYDRIMDIIEKSKRCALYIDDKTKLEFLKSKTSKKAHQIDADTKAKSKVYKNIVENESIGDIELLVNTSVLTASVNIKCPDITDIIIIGKKDIATIKQYIARFRELKECNIHIFACDPKETSDTYNIEHYVNYTVKNAKCDAEKKNKEYGFNHLISFGADTLKINLAHGIYLDADGIYKANEVHIRASIYDRYYDSRTTAQLKELLGEYFPSISIVCIDDSEVNESLKALKERRKFNKSEALTFLETAKDYLVGYEYITDKDLSSKSMPTALKRYMLENRLTYDVKTLEEKSILDAIKTGKVENIVKQFSKFVLEYGYTTGLAWSIAILHPEKQKAFKDKLEILAHKKTLEDCPQAVKKTLNTDIYDYLVERLPLGAEYNKDKAYIIAQELFDKGIKTDTENLLDFINNMYIVSDRKKRTIVENDTTKRITYYILQDYVSIDSIKKELALSQSDNSVRNIINLKVDYYKSDITDIDDIKDVYNM